MRSDKGAVALCFIFHDIKLSTRLLINDSTINGLLLTQWIEDFLKFPNDDIVV